MSEETQPNITEIKRKTEEFFQKLGLSPLLTIKKEEEIIKIDLRGEELSDWIGEKGSFLQTIEYLLARVLRKELGGLRLFLDINQYRQRREEYLRELALEVANEVSLTKTPKELPPMPARERRIIHLALKDRGDVFTESEGEEPNRRVVIKPKVLP